MEVVVFVLNNAFPWKIKCNQTFGEKVNSGEKISWLQNTLTLQKHLHLLKCFHHEPIKYGAKNWEFDFIVIQDK